MKKSYIHCMFIAGIIYDVLSAVPGNDDLRKIQEYIKTIDFLRLMNQRRVLPNEKSLRSAFRSIVDFELNQQELQFILDSINQAFRNEYFAYTVRSGLSKNFATMKKFDEKFDGNSLPMPPSGFVYRKGRGDRLFPINMTERLTILSAAPLEGQYIPTVKTKVVKISDKNQRLLLRALGVVKALKLKRA